MAIVAAALAACWGSSTSPTASPLPAAQGVARDVPTAPQHLVDDVPFRRILCFGDSITYGVTLEALSLPPGTQANLTLVEGYVPKLWRLLEAKYGSGFELSNAGIPGETTSEGRDRLRTEMRIHDPDLVLLLEGVVDINNETPRFAVVRDNLLDMMRQVKREGREVIVGTYPLLNPSGFRTSGAENVPRLNDLVRQEAGRLGVTVADHEKTVDLSGQGPDGLHPNERGYETMASTWLLAIEALAEQLDES
jgi:lysophospholipase L1-like esterase